MAPPYGVPLPPSGYQPPPTQAKILLLACLPVDTADLLVVAGGMRIRMPTPRDARTNCEDLRCKRPVWIGEKQRYCRSTNPLRAVVLCYQCAMRVTDGRILGLGGGYES